MNQEPFIAIDPGINHCGLALFEMGALQHAHLIKNPLKKGGRLHRAHAMGRAVANWYSPDDHKITCRVVAEFPPIYPGRKSKGFQQPMMLLAAVLGAIVGHAVYYDPVPAIDYLPREWKGTVDGDAFLSIIMSRLEEGEREYMQDSALAKNLEHNRIDAVGIGLKFLGRLEPKIVVHR